MGMYFDIQKAWQALKRAREQHGISIAEVAKRSGLDRDVVSRLENGKQDNGGSNIDDNCLDWPLGGHCL